MREGLTKIDTWHFRLDQMQFPNVMSAEEGARARGISDPVRRRHYEQIRSAVRHVLASCADVAPEKIAFAIGPAGKPRILDRSDCEFSISHSGGALVIATAGKAIGVDIETRIPRVDIMALGRRFFSGGDFEFLRRVETTQRAEAFRSQWVAKEAALKAAGCGLANHLQLAECEYRTGTVRAVRWDDQYFSTQPFHLDDGTPGALAWAGGGGADIRWRDAAELGH